METELSNVYGIWLCDFKNFKQEYPEFPAGRRAQRMRYTDSYIDSE